MEIGGGIGLTDVIFFIGLKNLFAPPAIFVVGNAFGYSAFILAEIFDNAVIDVIDAGSEGSFNARGNEITQRIAEEFYPNVRLTVGTSPQDLPRAARSSEYGLIVIDGEHSDEAQQRDFAGLLPYAAERSVVYLHDVDLCSMQTSYRSIRELGAQHRFQSFNVDFSYFGCKALVRNLPAVEQWLAAIDRSPCADLAAPAAHNSVRTSELFLELDRHARNGGPKMVKLASGKRLTFAEVYEGLARLLMP
jgi:hypothetical protein